MRGLSAAYALYERATRVYVQIKSALDGTYTRPRKMMQRQACLRQLCEIEDRIAGAQVCGWRAFSVLSPPGIHRYVGACQGDLRCGALIITCRPVVP